MSTSISNKESRLNSTLLKQQITFFEKVLAPALSQILDAINGGDRAEQLSPILQSILEELQRDTPHEQLLPTLQLILESLQTTVTPEELYIEISDSYRARIYETTGVGEIPPGSISPSICNIGDYPGLVADIDELGTVRMVPLPPKTTVNWGQVDSLFAIPYNATGTKFLLNYTQQVDIEYHLLKVGDNTMLIDDQGNFLIVS